MSTKSTRVAATLSTIAALFAIGTAAASTATAQPAPHAGKSPLHSLITAGDGMRSTVATASQLNAIASAQTYLEVGAFSRSGLIKQLEYEKYSTADATYAVDHITVNWNQQAAKSAKTYLEVSSFSRQGLIDQLEYEGFTPSQASYGATAAGL